jgi:hypothetical protein
MINMVDLATIGLRWRPSGVSHVYKGWKRANCPLELFDSGFRRFIKGCWSLKALPELLDRPTSGTRPVQV